MTNEQISAIINILRCMEKITPLQKDILDTWDTLCKNPFDEDAAKKQIVSNDCNHPKIKIAVDAKPTTVQKRPEDITQIDLVYILQSQLEFLIVKEMQNNASSARTKYPET